MSSYFAYQKIAEYYKEKIQSNQLPFGTYLPSEFSIATSFNVERGTVRRAINLLVNEKLVEKFPGKGTKVIFGEEEHVKDSISYREVGFVIADSSENSRKLSQPYYADLFKCLDMECNKNNFQLTYASINSNKDIEAFLNDHNFAYLIFVSKTPQQWIDSAKERKIPTMMVNDSQPNLLSISCNHCNGAYQVINYLIEMGHKNIALVTGPSNSYTSDEKLFGCSKAFKENPFLVVTKYKGDWEYQSGYNCALEILKQETRPTAIFAFNDMMSIGAIQAINDAGLEIPQDISIVGFDNMEQLNFTRPNLTTVDANTKIVAKVIINCISSSAFTEIQNSMTIQVESTLVVRESVRKLN